MMPRLLSYRKCAYLLALTLGVSVSAQTPRSSAGTAVLQATSRIVYVDVVVRDASGKIVQNLKREAFQLTEDKQAQRISFFEAHTSKPPAPERAANGAPSELSNVASSARDTNLNLVLLDLLDTPLQQQAYARKRMIEFLRKLPPGEQVALFVLNDRLRMVQGFSTDSAALAKAAQGINLQEVSRFRSVHQQITDNDSSAFLDIGATGGFGIGQNLQIALGSEDEQNIKVRLGDVATAFHEIARAVNGYPGRKNLFWLAGQFPSTDYYRLGSLAGPLLTNLPSGLGEGSFNELIGSSRSLAPGLGQDTFEEKADKAVADSQIAVYPISLVGVQTDLVGASSMGVGTAGSSAAASDTAQLFFNERQTGRAVMEGIADKTGGEAFYGNNDPAVMLQRGFEDSDNYYEIAYQPTNHNWDGQFRSIKVALKGGGYHLSYRKGYYALPEQPANNSLASFASAMRIEAPPSTQLVIRATPPSIAAGALRMNIKVDPRGVGFTLDDSGDRRARLQVMLIAYPIQGDGTLAQNNNLLKLGLTQADYHSLLTSGIPFQQALPLKPGRYAVRLGIVDLGSGRIGTLTLPFTMPAS